MKTILFILITIFSTTIFAQTEDLSRMGIGISGGNGYTYHEGLATLNLYSVYLPINVSEHFRLEPEIGYYRYGSSKDELDSSLSYTRLGVGIFGVSRYEKVNIYWGGRFGLYHQSFDFDDHDDSETDYFIAAAIGAEYFFIPRFSLGAEAQVELVHIDFDEGYYTLQNKTHLFIRWYF